MEPWREELYHHGIKGQKHGVNRYQTADGTWTEEGLRRRRAREGFGEGKNVAKVASNKLKSIKSNISKSIKKRRAATQKKKQERAKVREEKEQAKQAKIDEAARIAEEKRVKSRDEALRRGNAEDILKYQGEYTNQELRTALERIDLEQKLSKLTEPKTKSGMDYVNSALGLLGTVSKAAGGLADVVNNVNRLTDAIDNGATEKAEKEAKERAEAKRKQQEARNPYAEKMAKEFIKDLQAGNVTMDEIQEKQKQLNSLVGIEYISRYGTLMSGKNK